MRVLEGEIVEVSQSTIYNDGVIYAHLMVRQADGARVRVSKVACDSQVDTRISVGAKVKLHIIGACLFRYSNRVIAVEDASGVTVARKPGVAMRITYNLAMLALLPVVAVISLLVPPVGIIAALGMGYEWWIIGQLFRERTAVGGMTLDVPAGMAVQNF